MKLQPLASLGPRAGTETWRPTVQPFMSEPGFEAAIEQVGGERVVVFRGDLDLNASEALWRCIEQVRGGGRPVTVDLAETTFMDSSGINVLLRALVVQARADQAVTLRSPSDAVRQTLALTGIWDAFRIEHERRTSS